MTNEITLYNKKKWSIDPRLKQNMDILVSDLAKSEMDALIVIDGAEGTGKSFCARSLGRYLATVLRNKYGYKNTTCGPEDTTFELEAYVNESLKHKSPDEKLKVKINILDEARNVANRKRSHSTVNLRFTNFLSECRALRQIHIICVPAFHDLDRYIINWRTRCIIHFQKNYKTVKGGYEMVKGRYQFITDKNGIRYCFDKPYNYPKPDFTSDWCHEEVYSKKELEKYNNLKYEATIRKYGQEDVKDTSSLEEPESNYLSFKEASEILGVTKTTFSTWAKLGKLPYVNVKDQYARSGGKRLVLRRDVEKMLMSHSVKKDKLLY